jgi:predicted 2-oxoglutarate/Fe(II)-dependent dioxygenase YbiX/peroxiredoxin
MTVSEAPARKPDFASILAGDAAPWFKQRTASNPRYTFDSVGGRWIVLGFVGSFGDEAGLEAFKAVAAHRDLFDDSHASFFGVSLDGRDEAAGRLKDRLPGLRFFHDFDGAVSRLYGAVPRSYVPGGEVALRRFWMIVDPTLRVEAVFPLAEAERCFAHLRKLPPPSRFVGFEVPPPILVLPKVFEPALCRELVGLYEQQGGEESGFMREVEGKTVPVQDHSYKRRRDLTIEDGELKGILQSRIMRRVVPEIAKIFAFRVTRMERYIVGCYAAEDQAHFSPHRDNTTKGTAHRRFAVSINLNEDFEGGEVGFPEYGPRTFKAPPGGAIIFPCALLHAVSKVTAGRRYTFLPFLYDEAAAKLREQNAKYLEGGTYTANAAPA